MDLMPVMRDEHGAVEDKTLKELFAKINEELDELKAAVFREVPISGIDSVAGSVYGGGIRRMIADEAADTITAITTLCEALGIDAGARAAAIARVNEKNWERGRL